MVRNPLSTALDGLLPPPPISKACLSPIGISAMPLHSHGHVRQIPDRSARSERFQLKREWSPVASFGLSQRYLSRRLKDMARVWIPELESLIVRLHNNVMLVTDNASLPC